ncbi:D-alanyl-D-alanine carboxypeptidase [Azospirillum lipoferum]|uniref:D-alanyl-D-alanine carboxypeptidase n=1 Tax=Azospirillum lipoferum TaxID=193 RepID=A0A5A9GJD6_AZOLI|nr:MULTISPECIES: D-alanyl-D-alanine carboxypeptidase family protein [Azospirillum]KAA0593824.1 D-alanyl-D-alanine carboxypeptidase [Azospirillum lipoferum]MCP1614111.1 D-alanyl-D-alanine carboxypeptidase [Azospirillum lipoferum]MDW5536798.1 D-alanyl-D-alanine carboxypeptidase family protein [Azospirillum sp. NL1]
MHPLARVSTLLFSLTALMALAAVLLAPLPASAKGSAKKASAPVAAEILMDAGSGRVLQARNADTLTYPASLTKMMTLMLTFEALDRGTLRLDQSLVVSQHAASMPPSRLWLAPGSTITVEQAILALVTRSANDVAVVLGEALGGSETAFAAKMTARARAIGMRRTVFRNASGLPDRLQRTTARDMAILSRALIRSHARHYAYFNRRSFDWQGDMVYGHNRLMARYPGMDGIKTGYIAASGFNLAASAVRDGRRLIAVVMGGHSANSRDDRVADLLDAGFKRPTSPAKPAPVQPDLLITKNSASITERNTAVSVGVPAAKSTGGPWAIQVGAFASHAAAQRSAHATAKRLGALAAGASPAVVRSGGLYKARLTGFAAAKADAACTVLKTAGKGCFALQDR